ncbi:hypothetical protein BGZ58_000436, partial [Dissophora ornata]
LLSGRKTLASSRTSDAARVKALHSSLRMPSKVSQLARTSRCSSCRLGRVIIMGTNLLTWIIIQRAKTAVLILLILALLLFFLIDIPWNVGPVPTRWNCCQANVYLKNRPLLRKYRMSRWCRVYKPLWTIVALCFPMKRRKCFPRAPNLHSRLVGMEMDKIVLKPLTYHRTSKKRHYSC